MTRTTGPADYVGEYTRADGVPIYVASSPDGLFVVVSGNVLGLEKRADDRFDIADVSESVTFDRDESGNVVSVTDSNGRYPKVNAKLPADIAARFQRASASAYRYAPPQAHAEPGLPMPSDAGDLGFDIQRIEALVSDIWSDPDYSDVHGLIVARDGSLALEQYFGGYSENRPHNLRSATKGVISALVGIMVEDGSISLDDHPFQHIARKRGVEAGEHVAGLTLGDMLDMRHGLSCDDWDETSPGHESRIYPTPDWMDTILRIPASESPAMASYCSAMPLAVGRYLELVTERPLPDLAEAHLFTPLGISREHWTWDFTLASGDGVHGAQVHLRPRDMLKIGEMYRRGGLAHDGERILGEAWVHDTFDAQMPLGDWRRYSRYWWSYSINREGRSPTDVHMASGIGGQRIAVIPELDITIVLTGGSFSRGRGGPRKIIEHIIDVADGS